MPERDEIEPAIHEPILRATGGINYKAVTIEVLKMAGSVVVACVALHENFSVKRK